MIKYSSGFQCEKIVCRNFDDATSHVIVGRSIINFDQGRTVESKTQHALRLVDQGMNPHAAAKEAGIRPNSVYVAIKRRKLAQAGICPCCGQPLPPDKKVLQP